MFYVENDVTTYRRDIDVLRESARSEFENNRNIENTEEIARLLYIGNDALSQAMQKASEKAQNMSDSSSKES